MIHRQMEAWKKFIRGRIAQEQGREEEALRGFEQAIEIDPNNKYLREASEVAKRNLSRNLSRSDEDHLLHVQACYEQIAQTITSQNERLEGFKEMLAELEGRPPIDGYVPEHAKEDSILDGTEARRCHQWGKTTSQRTLIKEAKNRSLVRDLPLAKPQQCPYSPVGFAFRNPAMKV